MSAMRKTINHLLHGFLSLGLCVFCAMALAIPKAAEQEDDEVTFGTADAPPKPAAKHVASPAAKAVKPVESRVDRPHPGAKGAGRLASQPVAASKQAVGSKPPPTAKAKRSAQVPTRTTLATKKDSGKAEGKSGKK